MTVPLDQLLSFLEWADDDPQYPLLRKMAGVPEAQPQQHTQVMLRRLLQPGSDVNMVLQIWSERAAAGTQDKFLTEWSKKCSIKVVQMVPSLHETVHSAYVNQSINECTGSMLPNSNKLPHVGWPAHLAGSAVPNCLPLLVCSRERLACTGCIVWQ